MALPASVFQGHTCTPLCFPMAKRSGILGRFCPHEWNIFVNIGMDEVLLECSISLAEFGICTHGLTLIRQELYHLSLSPSLPFLLGIFEIDLPKYLPKLA